MPSVLSARSLFRSPHRFRWFAGLVIGAALLPAARAQDSEHGRKYKPPPPLAHIVVTVEKGFNGKPFPNAAVVFHATREGHDDGNLELKTDPDGKATIDVIEVGSHLTVQVIASGFATYASDFDVTADSKDLLVRLQRPRAQISQYGDAGDQASQVQPGIQEPRHAVSNTSSAAATASATVTGKVLDSKGVSIPGAVVTIRDESGTRPPVRVLASESGSFSRNNLPPATYEVTISASGFTPQTHSHVVLDGGEERIFADRLEVSGKDEPLSNQPTAAPQSQASAPDIQ